MMHMGAKSIAAGFFFAATHCDAAPLKGSLLTAQSDGKPVLNEPCFVFDSACEGYPVCCVSVGTCVAILSGTISSNTAYYEGGCQSLNSTKKTWSNPNCTQ